MALTFTNDQLIELSKTRAQFPELIAAALQGKAQIEATKVEAGELDEQNKQFTDFYKAIIDNYHLQSTYYREEVRTNFPGEPNIQDAGVRGEIHYPFNPLTNVWKYLFPKLVPSLNGNSRSTFTGVSEVDAIAGAESAINLIQNGFNNGSGNTNLTSTYVVGSTSIDVDDTSDFSVGNQIIVTGGGNGMFAVITAITQDAGTCTGASGTDETTCVNNGGVWSAPLSGTFTLDVKSPPAANLPSNSSVRNSSGGFTNAQREESSGLTAGQQSTLQVYKSIVDDAIQAHENLLVNDVRPLVDSNEDQKEKASKQSELDNITLIQSQINTWQSFPSTNPTGSGTESRFGDIRLTELSTTFSTRSSQVTARAAQLDTILGVLNQDNSSGEYSGNGRYYDYFDWMSKRVHAANGSLSKFNNLDIAVQVANNNISNINSTKDETDSLFIIAKITEDANGSNIVKVDSVVGYSNGDTLKVIAEGQPIITTTITNVGTLELTLADQISADYSLGSVARVLKEI